MSPKSQKLTVAAAVRYLKNLSGGEIELLLYAIEKKIKKTSKTSIQWLENIQKFCEVYLHDIANKSRIGSILTLGVSVREASKITNLSESSIKWGRCEILGGSYKLLGSFVPATSEASKAERSWFKEFVFGYSPVKSGSLNDRKLVFNVYTGFHQVYSLAANENGFPVRSLSTMISWIKDLGIKRCSFDRYRWEKCYEGRIS